MSGYVKWKRLGRRLRSVAGPQGTSTVSVIC
jgi:hypothetical protein